MNLDSLQHRLLSWCRKVLACCSLCHRYKTELARCNAELQRQIAASAEKERTLRKECEGRMACLEDLRRKNFELEKTSGSRPSFSAPCRTSSRHRSILFWVSPRCCVTRSSAR